MSEHRTRAKKVHWGVHWGRIRTHRPACNQWAGGLKAVRYQYAQSLDGVTCKRCRAAVKIAMGTL